MVGEKRSRATPIGVAASSISHNVYYVITFAACLIESTRSRFPAAAVEGFIWGGVAFIFTCSQSATVGHSVARGDRHLCLALAVFGVKQHLCQQSCLEYAPNIDRRRSGAAHSRHPAMAWRCINHIPFRQIPGGWENVPVESC